MSPLPDLVVSSDASGSHGFGALWRTEWFCSSWLFLPSRLSIAFLELVPIVVAAHLWGCAWFPLRVQFLCDNMAVCMYVCKTLFQHAIFVNYLHQLVSTKGVLRTLNLKYITRHTLITLLITNINLS